MTNHCVAMGSEAASNKNQLSLRSPPPLDRKESMNQPISSFVKMSGAGNLFLLIDFRDFESQKKWQSAFPSQLTRPQIVQLLCQSPKGFSADGLLFIETLSDAEEDFRWDFYNADGSSAEMCGNAARCAARFAHTRGGVNRKMTFLTKAGTVTATLLDNEKVEVEMPPVEPQKIPLGLSVEWENQKLTKINFLNTGVPHVTVSLESPAFSRMMNSKNIITANSSFHELALYLRHHSYFQPQGANVTFFCQQTKNSLRALSFERGVENFTQACGTGAVAAAWSFHQLHPLSKNIEVIMPGGSLEVDFSHPRPKLRGEASYLAEIKLHLDFFSKNETLNLI